MNARSLVALLLVAGAGCASSTDPCVAAADHVAECLPEAPAAPADGTCDVAAAEQILDMTCDEIANGGGKSDGLFDNVLCGLGALCHCAPVPGVPDQQILSDEHDYGCGGPCRGEESGGFNGTGFSWAPANHGAHGAWQIPLSEAGTYHVRAYIPVFAGAGIATYVADTCSNWTPVEVDQAVSQSGWVDVGDFDLEPGATIEIGAKTGSVFIADALEVTRLR